MNGNSERLYAQIEPPFGLAVAQLDERIERVRGREAQRAACRPAIGVVARMPGQAIHAIAVVAHDVHGYPASDDVLDDRSAERSFDVHGIEAPGFDAHVALRLSASACA